MPLIKLQFKPGVNRDQTNYSGEGGWFVSEKIRFRSGYPEKIGGWLKYTANTFIGIAREHCGWITTYQDNILAVGTNKKLYVETGGTYQDITPIRATFTTPATNNSIATSVGTKTLTITIVGHGGLVGDYVTLSGVVGALGGIPAAEMNAEFVILTVPTTDSFTVAVSTTNATSTATGGGVTIVAAFQIAGGDAYVSYGYGWGSGTYSRGTWGSGSTSPVYIDQRDWWLDNFDNDLVANIRGGAIYYWARGVGTSPDFGTRATLLSAQVGATDVPAIANQVLVAQTQKFLLAFGCTPFGGGAVDPMLIRWTDQNDPLNWTPAVTNLSGFLRLSGGSKIVTARNARQETLVWTTSHLYSLQFLGTTDVFGVQEYGDNISIISPRATANVNNVTYWMGVDKFYAYSGRLETLPCTLRSHIFFDLNRDQAAQVVCGTNEGFNEVWWLYPSANSVVNDRYVIYNHLEQIWYYGTIARNSWQDSSLRDYPQASTFDSVTGLSQMYDHERGVDDDLTGMTSYIESSDMDIGDGEKFMLTKRIIPDLNFNGSDRVANPTPTATFTLKVRNTPGNGLTDSDEGAQSIVESSVDIYTTQIFVRARARQVALRVGSTEAGVRWQLGSPRLEGREDGKR